MIPACPSPVPQFSKVATAVNYVEAREKLGFVVNARQMLKVESDRRDIRRALQRLANRVQAMCEMDLGDGLVFARIISSVVF